MKSSLLRLTLLGLSLSSALFVHTLRADDSTAPSPSGPPPGMHHHHGMLPPGFDQLNLTDDQKAKIKAILEDSHKQIEAVLTDDQKAKLEALKKEHMGHHGEGDKDAPPAGN